MRVTRLFRPSIVAPLLCLVYAVVIALAAGHTFVWVTPALKLAPPELQPYAYSDWGYDGFYSYLIARDPLQAPQYLDAAPYRFQRALLPGIARVLAFGSMEVLPLVLLGVNLLALAVGTRALEYLIEQAGYNPWYAVGYAFSLTAFGSTRLTMTEPLAYGLVLVAIVLAQRRVWVGSAVLFALAALAKETTLFFPAAYGVYLLVQGQRRQAVTFGAIVLLPFFIWQLLIYGYFGVWGIGSGGSTDTGFELLPFGAFLRMLQLSGVTGALFWIVLLGPSVILPVLWGFWRCWHDLRKHTWTLHTGVLFANLLILPFTPFSTFSEPIAIFRFIAGLQIALIWYTANRQLTRPLRFTTLWMFSGALVISSDYFVLMGQ